MIKFIKKKKGGAAPMRKTIDSQSIICTTETNLILSTKINEEKYCSSRLVLNRLKFKELPYLEMDANVIDSMCLCDIHNNFRLNLMNVRNCMNLTISPIIFFFSLVSYSEQTLDL